MDPIGVLYEPLNKEEQASDPLVAPMQDFNVLYIARFDIHYTTTTITMIW